MSAHNPPDAYLAMVPVLDTTRPNFRSAGWRAVEAANRMQALLERIPDLSKEWKGHPVVRAPKSAPDELQVSVQDWSWSQMPTARALTLLASEIVHHARVALDYTAYHVVWLDSGKPRHGTKFPLINDVNRWGKEKRGALPGITAEHALWIKDVQPFAGVEWSHNLLQLSNRDKHRMAVEVIPIYRCSVDRTRLYADPLGDAGFWGYQINDVHLELAIAPAMTPVQNAETRLPLESTLGAILQGVADLVSRFLVEAGDGPISVSFVTPSC